MNGTGTGDHWFPIHREQPVSEIFHLVVNAVHAKLEQLHDCDRTEARHDCPPALREVLQRVAVRDRHSLEELLDLLDRELPEQHVHSIFAPRSDDEPLPGV